MTKPTGRPRGRPKTKEYITLMARVPQELAEQVQRYAGRKRQTISDVLRDGLLVLLEEEEPYRQFMSDGNTETDIMLGRKEHSFITSDIKRGEQGAPTLIMSYSKKDNAPMMSDTKEAQANIESDVNTVDKIESDTKGGQSPIVSDSITDFDPEKYILGKLCPRAHEYHGTGKTLLKRTNRHCMACDREKFHERKQTKRAK